jgi:hypothetical protein
MLLRRERVSAFDARVPEWAPRAFCERRAGRCVPLHSILVVGAGGRRRFLPVQATIAIASLLRFAFGLVTALSKVHTGGLTHPALPVHPDHG